MYSRRTYGCLLSNELCTSLLGCLWLEILKKNCGPFFSGHPYSFAQFCIVIYGSVCFFYNPAGSNMALYIRSCRVFISPPCIVMVSNIKSYFIVLYGQELSIWSIRAKCGQTRPNRVKRGYFLHAGLFFERKKSCLATQALR